MSSTSHSPSLSVAIHGFDPRLIRYGSICLLIVGTFGNIVSFFIFSYGTLRRSSTFRYLALLSLMDLLVLYSGLLDLFLMIEYDGLYSLRNISPVTCRLHTFITYWSQHSSSWILSFISVDRAVATNCIKFARKFCTPRSAEYIVGLILTFIALLNCHELIFLHLQESTVVDTGSNVTSHSSRNSSLLTSSGPVEPQRAIQAFLTICDKSPWNFFCRRSKRDLASSNMTNDLFDMKPRELIRKCEPLTGSRYEYVWDHVRFVIDADNNSERRVYLSCSGLGMDRRVSLCYYSVHCYEHRHISHRLSCLLSTTARFSFSSIETVEFDWCRAQSSEKLVLSTFHTQFALLYSCQSCCLCDDDTLS
jgi:hypothetical protein